MTEIPPETSCAPLTRAEVLSLYQDVTAALDVPLCVYDNPSTLASPSTTNYLLRFRRDRRSHR